MARSKVTLYNGSVMSVRRGAYVAPPLFRRDADGTYHEATRREVIDNALALSYRAGFDARSLSAPASVREFLRVRLASLDYEMFACLFLDNRHRLIEYREIFRGTIDGASVHPREIVRDAMEVNAAAVIFAHNHPSGVAEPSQADELITKRLRDALAVVDIRVLDHILVAGPTMLSFAERGLL